MIKQSTHGFGYYICEKDKYGRDWYFRTGCETWMLSSPTFFKSPPDETIVPPFRPEWAEEYNDWYHAHKGGCSDKCACVVNPSRF